MHEVPLGSACVQCTETSEVSRVSPLRIFRTNTVSQCSTQVDASGYDAVQSLTTLDLQNTVTIGSAFSHGTKKNCLTGFDLLSLGWQPPTGCCDSVPAAPQMVLRKHISTLRFSNANLSKNSKKRGLGGAIAEQGQGNPRLHREPRVCFCYGCGHLAGLGTHIINCECSHIVNDHCRHPIFCSKLRVTLYTQRCKR